MGRFVVPRGGIVSTHARLCAILHLLVPTCGVSFPSQLLALAVGSLPRCLVGQEGSRVGSMLIRYLKLL